MQTSETPSAYDELVAKIEQAVPDIEKRRLQQRESVVACLDGLYWCSRVWSAWSFGTMGPDDFEPAWENDDAIDNFATNDITIEDVLRWVETLGLSKHFIVLPSGNIYLFEGGYLDVPKAQWKLGLPLSRQTPAVHTFLHSLLCK